jgi:hypothetical protein
LLLLLLPLLLRQKRNRRSIVFRPGAGWNGGTCKRKRLANLAPR